MALKPNEVGSKCKIHEVFYETQYMENGKTREYCPKCEEEKFDPLMKLFIEERDGILL